MQDAINQISGIVNYFVEVQKISVTGSGQTTVYYSGSKTKSFTNSVSLLEWCETNLTIR